MLDCWPCQTPQTWCCITPQLWCYTPGLREQHFHSFHPTPEWTRSWSHAKHHKRDVDLHHKRDVELPIMPNTLSKFASSIVTIFIKQTISKSIFHSDIFVLQYVWVEQKEKWKKSYTTAPLVTRSDVGRLQSPQCAACHYSDDATKTKRKYTYNNLAHVQCWHDE